MLWVAPSEKDTATNTLEKRLWDAADQLRANSGLNAGQYSTPVLGLIFLRFADVRFAKIRSASNEVNLKILLHNQTKLGRSRFFSINGIVSYWGGTMIRKFRSGIYEDHL